MKETEIMTKAASSLSLQQTTTKETKTWKNLDADQIIAAINRICKQRPDTVTLTHSFSLRGSRYKEQEVLWAQVCVTNLASKLLSLIWNDIQQPADNGFIAWMTAKLESSKDKKWVYGNKRDALSAVILAYCNATPGLTRKDYRISSPIRQGVADLCTQVIFSWITKVRSRAQCTDKNVINDESRAHLFLVDYLSDAYQQWLQLHTAYEQALDQVMPFGRYQGKSFREVSRREIRWLRERLPSPDVIKEIRNQLHVLLNQTIYPMSRIKKAENTRHPWRCTRKNKRHAVRASRYEHPIANKPGKPVFLAELNTYELELLDRQLAEMEEFAHQFELLRNDVETILHDRPSSFPSITPIPEANEDERIRAYHTHLEWFAHPFPSRAHPSSWNTYDSLKLEQLEAQARDRLLRTAGTLQEPRLLPLTIPRTMYPPNKTESFALLYTPYTPSRETLEQRYRHMSSKQCKKNIERDLQQGTVYRYSLAVLIHGKSAFTYKGGSSAVRTQRPVRIQADELNETMRRTFYYVNFPMTEFSFPRYSAILRFSIQCGRKGHQNGIPHSEQLLNEIVARQNEAQTETHRACLQKDPDAQIEDCLPDAVLKWAQIISQPNSQGHPELFLRLSVSHSVPSVVAPLRTIIAFHEYGDSYSYAVINSQGVVIEVGDVDPPWHVRRKKDESTYSDNYVHEITNAMVERAIQHQAFIGLEDTSYRRYATAHRKRNRQRFARPTVKIAATLQYKALLAGLPTPHMIGGVPYKHACGQCGTQLDEKITALSMQPPHVCHSCRTLPSNPYVHLPVLVKPDGQMIWMSIAHEPKNHTRMLESARFLLWIVTTGNDLAVAQGYPPLPDSLREQALDYLEHIAGNKNALQQPATLTAMPEQPCMQFIHLADNVPDPVYQQWIEAYRVVAPHVAMVFHRNSASSTSEANTELLGVHHKLCAVGDTEWNDDLWFDCIQCGTHMPARYNTAIVAARCTQEQLVERQDKVAHWYENTPD